jgi:serine/threonine protein kinase
VTDSKALEYLE